jgi:hypothetical protein
MNIENDAVCSYVFFPGLAAFLMMAALFRDSCPMQTVSSQYLC